MLLLVSTFTMRGALIAAGVMGFTAALAVLLVPVRPRPISAKVEGGPVSTSVWTPAILTLTLLFTMISLASAGISQFSIVAFMGGRGISFETANIALTAYLSMSAGGVLVGGYLADRTHRHDLVATINYGLNGVVLLCVAIIPMAPIVLIMVMGCAGFLSGSITASRDMMVRKAAPAGAIGRAFGIVSTGFNIGGIIGPLLYGWIMDHGMPLWVFYVTAVFMVGTSLATLFADYVRRSSQTAE
jgi:MFS family permease